MSGNTDRHEIPGDAGETGRVLMSSAPESQLLHFTEHGSGPPLLLVHGLMVTG